jgi:hypothetical protein
VLLAAIIFPEIVSVAAVPIAETGVRSARSGGPRTIGTDEEEDGTDDDGVVLAAALVAPLLGVVVAEIDEEEVAMADVAAEDVGVTGATEGEPTTDTGIDVLAAGSVTTGAGVDDVTTGVGAATGAGAGTAAGVVLSALAVEVVSANARRTNGKRNEVVDEGWIAEGADDDASGEELAEKPAGSVVLAEPTGVVVAAGVPPTTSQMNVMPTRVNCPAG